MALAATPTATPAALADGAGGTVTLESGAMGAVSEDLTVAGVPVGINADIGSTYSTVSIGVNFGETTTGGDPGHSKVIIPLVGKSGAKLNITIEKG